MAETCVFCQIAAGEVAAQTRYEDEWVMAFDDTHPQAPVHILIIPKQHLVSLAEAEDRDQALLGHLLLTVQRIAKEQGLSGYRTRINTGRAGGQVVDHLHLHLLSSADSAPI